jgi:hypothetical protein
MVDGKQTIMKSFSSKPLTIMKDVNIHKDENNQEKVSKSEIFTGAPDRQETIQKEDKDLC